VWMIDHTRAFRTSRALRNPALLGRLKIEPALLARLRDLTPASLESCCARYLSGEERTALLVRRDSLVARFR
jgi:hypothetical protein